MSNLSDLERHLADIYKDCYFKMYMQSNKFFAEFEKEDERMCEDVANGVISNSEYKRWRMVKMAEKQRLNGLTTQLCEMVNQTNHIAMSFINDNLSSFYANGYNALSKEADINFDYRFDIINEDAVRNLALDDIELLPTREVDDIKDYAYNRQKIRNRVLQGIIKGDSIDKMADDVARVTNLNMQTAIRNVRTMVTSAENKGRMDSYKRAKEDGVIIQKEWLATANSPRTRHWHLELNGAVAEIDEPFHNAYGDIMFPGDPNAHPANVYNCRCTLVAKINGFKKAQVQEAVEEEQVEEPKTETYSAFADGKQASQFFGEKPPRSLRRENREEYDRLLEEYRQSSFGSWFDGLSGEEITSIGQYSGDGYSGINGLLRGHMTEKMVKAWDDVSSIGIREMVDHIDDSISRFELKKGIKVYRTCEKDVFESLSTQVGSKFVDDGFVSTTVLNKKVASGNVFMEIDVPPGTGRGAWINPLSGSADEEWEFLLQRGSVFEITDVSDVGDDIVVKMKWTGIEKKDIKFASREDVIAWQKKNGLYDETEEYRI